MPCCVKAEPCSSAADSGCRGRYHSLDSSNGGKNHQTILEVFGHVKMVARFACSSKAYNPVLKSPPYPPGKPAKKSEQLKARVKVIADKEDVVKIDGPTETHHLGMRPIWRVTTSNYVVPNLRKSLEKQGWGVYSGDIPFLNRLFLDLDHSMHVHAKGEIIDTIDAPNNDMQQTAKCEQQVVLDVTVLTLR